MTGNRKPTQPQERLDPENPGARPEDEEDEQGGDAGDGGDDSDDNDTGDDGAIMVGMANTMQPHLTTKVCQHRTCKASPRDNG